MQGMTGRIMIDVVEVEDMVEVIVTVGDQGVVADLEEEGIDPEVEEEGEIEAEVETREEIEVIQETTEGAVTVLIDQMIHVIKWTLEWNEFYQL